jgi:translocator protein
MEFAVPRLLQHLLPPLLLGVGVQAALEPPARSWHRLLRKAPERPPPLAYPLVWTYCFLTLGYASYLLAKAQPTGAARGTGLLAHAAHFALLQSWQVVFLYCRDIRGGLRVMLALDVTVPVLLASYARVSPLAAVLLLPYLAWLFVLTYANWYMAEHNAGGGGGTD